MSEDFFFLNVYLSQGIKAIWSPNTGIVDWAKVNRSYVDDCKSKGADIYLNFTVKHFATQSKKEAQTSLVVCGQNMVCIFQI